MANGQAGGSPASEFSSVNFWSDKAEDAIDAAQQRRDGVPYAFVAGPSWVDRGRRKTVPVFACQGGTSADHRRGSLGSDGRILLVDLDRQRLSVAAVDHEEYSFEPAAEPANLESDTVDHGFGSSCTPLDLAKLFPRILQSGGFYKVLALHPGGLVEGFELEVGKTRGEHKDVPGNGPGLIAVENPIPADAWRQDDSPAFAAKGFALALDSSSGTRTLHLSVPLGAAVQARMVHVVAMDRRGGFVAWALVLPGTEKRVGFWLDPARLFPSVNASGGVVVGLGPSGVSQVVVPPQIAKGS